MMPFKGYAVVANQFVPVEGGWLLCTEGGEFGQTLRSYRGSFRATEPSETWNRMLRSSCETAILVTRDWMIRVEIREMEDDPTKVEFASIGAPVTLPNEKETE